MSKVVGIDLGSDHCSVAVVQEGEPRLVGAPLPTVVAFDDDGVHVGDEALPISGEHPMQFIDVFVRLVGRKFHSPEVDWLQACCPYLITSAPNGDAVVHVDGRDYTPQELCSYVLEAARQQAETELGLDVPAAVIAVPCTFDQLQRKAILDAARLANLEVARLVNNTSASAVGYAGLGAQKKRFALVDVGAGSFEVSLIELDGQAIKVLASAGDPLLGGADVDRRLVMLFLERAFEQTGSDLSVVPAALRRLLGRARRAKHRLSKHTKSEAFEIELPTGDDETVMFHFPGMTRRELVELSAQELASVKDPILWAFEDAGLGTDDIEEVVVVGGATRMPSLRSAFKYLFRSKPYRPAVADMLPAMGAAQIAHEIERGDGSLQLTDVASHSNGIKVRAGRFAPLILRNRPLPCRVVKVFQSAKRGKQRITFELYQGENELATDNTYLGRLRLAEIPADGRFPVAFEMNESGVLKISAVDLATNEERPVPLQHAGGLTEEELTALQKRRAERARPSSLPVPSAPGGLPAARFASVGGKTLKLTGTITQVNESPSKRFSRTQRPMPVTTGRQATGTLVMHADEPAKSVSSTTMKSEADAGGQRAAPKGAIEVGADSLVGSTLEGRYRIDSILADGGMGRVYLAEHTFLGKRFAIKVLHPELSNNREITARFIREARAASAIKSDHVVDISDFGTLEDGTGYFVMEYLEGKTLEEMVDERGPLRANLIRSIGIQVADGLRGAHELNIVHRDLKPANIVLVERPDHPHYCKILDFGIAKSPTSDTGSGQTLVTMVGVMMGTPHYMAPEQIDGVHIDGRSDIYALGIVLYEMAAGIPPFDAESVAEVLAQQKWGEVPPVHETYAEADCPRGLEAVIRKCLEKSPDDRYQTASELAEALASY